MEHSNNDKKKIYKSRIEYFSSDSRQLTIFQDNQIIELSKKNEYSFNYQFNEIRNVVGLRFLNIEIPFTYYIINENNNIFNWVSYDLLSDAMINNGHVLAKSSNNINNGEDKAIYYSAKITDFGYYSPSEFGEKIAKIMSDTEEINTVHPLSIYIISSENNKITIKETNNTEKFFTITIPEGNYNIIELTSYINSNLNSLSSSKGHGFNYTVSISSDFIKIKCTSTTGGKKTKIFFKSDATFEIELANNGWDKPNQKLLISDANWTNYSQFFNIGQQITSDISNINDNNTFPTTSQNAELPTSNQNQKNITLPSPGNKSIFAGQIVSGVGIQSGTKVSSYTQGATTLTLDKDVSQNGITSDLSFYPIQQKVANGSSTTKIILDFENNQIVPGLNIDGNNILKGTKILSISNDGTELTLSQQLQSPPNSGDILSFYYTSNNYISEIGDGSNSANKFIKLEFPINDDTNNSNNTISIIFSDSIINSYMNLGLIFGFGNDNDLELTNDSEVSGSNKILQNFADSDPWIYPWNKNENDFKINKYSHCYDNTSNTIKIKRAYGKFTFFKYNYEKTEPITIEKCSGFEFFKLLAGKEPDDNDAFDTSLFEQEQISKMVPQPNASNFIILSTGLHFNFYNYSKDMDTNSSNLIKIPINAKYKEMITYSNNQIFKIFPQNLSELDINLYYPDDATIMKETNEPPRTASGGIPVNFSIEFLYDDEANLF